METDVLVKISDRTGKKSAIDDLIPNGNHVTYGSMGKTCATKNLECGTRKDPQVAKIRWYILLVFSLTTTLQHAAWDTWGPIAQSSKAAYGWTTGILTTMINCGNAGAVIGLIPAAYLVNIKGLRPAMVVCLLCLTGGCAIRAVSMEHVTATILIGLGQVFIGLSGSVTTVLPSVISEAWFPCSERTTATAIGIISNAIGGIVAFLLGPNLVTQPGFVYHGRSNHTNNTEFSLTDKEISTIQSQTRLLLCIKTLWAVTLLLMTVKYYPSKPDQHPSISAAVHRLSFRKSFCEIIRKRHAVVISLICAISWGCFGNWLGLLDVIFHHTGVSQKEAGWYGVYGFTCGTIAGLLVGRMIDVFRKHHKPVLVFLFILALIFITWISMISSGYVSSSNVINSVTTSVFSISMYSATPILFEAACEIAHPAGEEMVGLFIGIAKNATAVLFLLVGIFPHIDSQWITWTVVGVTGTCIPALLFVKITYNRIDLDSG